MFGRPAQASSTPPGPVAAAPGADTSPAPDEPRQEPIPPGLGGWGNQANFSLAGPPGKLQILIADLWTQWSRPWALLGILIVGLVVAVILS